MSDVPLQAARGGWGECGGRVRSKTRAGCAWPFCAEEVFLAPSACKVILHNSIPTQIRQYDFIPVIVKDMLTDLWGCRLLQNDF